MPFDHAHLVNSSPSPSLVYIAGLSEDESFTEIETPSGNVSDDSEMEDD